MIYNQSMSEKPKATVSFRLQNDGEVIGELRDEEGNIIVEKRLGKFTLEEFKKVLELMQQENPDIHVLTIKPTKN